MVIGDTLGGRHGEHTGVGHKLDVRNKGGQLPTLAAKN